MNNSRYLSKAVYELPISVLPNGHNFYLIIACEIDQHSFSQDKIKVHLS